MHPDRPLEPGLPVHLHTICFPREPSNAHHDPSHQYRLSGYTIVPLEFKGRLSNQRSAAGEVVEFAIRNEIQNAPLKRAILRINTSHLPYAIAWTSFAEQLTRRLLMVKGAYWPTSDADQTVTNWEEAETPLAPRIPHARIMYRYPGETNTQPPIHDTHSPTCPPLEPRR
ncbi:hypothetical protein OH77DRAFT_336288 [Trametes cingulata]|nr:hypothetical protein OH77DRAFT_336288 [Trametes cingulata]